MCTCFLSQISAVCNCLWYAQIVLLGVCPTRRNVTLPHTDSDEITLQPLPMYTVPSDNIIMTSVATTTAAGMLG